MREIEKERERERERERENWDESFSECNTLYPIPAAAHQNLKQS